MMSQPEVPNFGELLAPFIEAVPEARRPNFLAMLERGAAERYRRWASELPDHAEGLLMCSQREDEIADTIDGLFPIDEATRAQVAEPLPEARDTYYAVFNDLPIFDQLAIQADAERQGAAAWRAMLEETQDPETRSRLEHCALLEETSGAYLDELIRA